VFVVFFWAAYEQAGNVQNLWADKHTERNLTQPAPKPNLFPEASAASKPKEAGQAAGAASYWERFLNMFRLKPRPPESWSDWLERNLNPVPTAWYQWINALAIVAIAPLFAWLWLWLDRRGWQPSIPMKMVLGLILMSASMAIMIGAAQTQELPSTAKYAGDKLPPPLELTPDNKVAIRNKEGQA
jgi:dipeptide/tripeptide permease